MERSDLNLVKPRLVMYFKWLLKSNQSAEGIVLFLNLIMCFPMVSSKLKGQRVH